MGRIRLQICVQPWEQPASSHSSSAQARLEVKWCEPCSEDTPMQDVCDRISKSWERMFKESMGPLRIRHLKNAYGDFLDLHERVAGDFFDDRGADGNIRNSVLEVHRYPPTPDQLDILQRFSSLAPTSSVRPRKRPLELPSLSYPLQSSPNIHRDIPSIEQWDAEAMTSFGTATKRQRTHESRLNGTFGAPSELNMRREHVGRPFDSSQTSGTQGSIHQVLDSQKSPGKKHSNPYGTPTSIALAGQPDSLPSSEIDPSAIPDSPLGRGSTSARGTFARALPLDRESTKSESPEIRASVHEIPPTVFNDASGEQPNTSATSSEPSTNPSVLMSSSQPESTSQIVHVYPRDYGLGMRKTSEKVADIDGTPKPKSSEPTHTQNVQTHNRTLPESDPVFDPIESDTESFLEKQQMQSAKRLRSSQRHAATSHSFRASNTEGNCRDGQFVVPSLPQSRLNATRKALSEASHGPGQRENSPMPTRGLMDGNTSVQNDLSQEDKLNTVTREAQSQVCNNVRLKLAQETPKSNATSNDLMDATPTSSQAMSALSQGSKSSVDNTRESNVRQGDTSVSSQSESQEPVHPGCDVDFAASNLDDGRDSRQTEQLAGEAEEQQANNRIRQKEAEEKRSTREAAEKQTEARKEAIERNAEGHKLAGKNDAKEEQARIEELAQAKKAKAKERALAELKRMEETRANEARILEEKKSSERLARERQIREASFVEKLNSTMLEAEGAKQIETEKKAKEKARLEELAAKKHANEAKADEQVSKAQGKSHEKKAREERCVQEKARKLADSKCKDAEGQVLPARTTRETATAVREQAQSRIAAREAQKLRDSTEIQSQRSMTPRIPESSVIQSSPAMTRSSPLSIRSQGTMDAPLRSALRQNSSTLRRSVSSVSFDVPQRARLNEHMAPTPNSKFHKKPINEVTTPPSSATKLPTSTPETTSNPPSKTPLKTPIPKKISDAKVTKTPAKNGKIQTKLNVTREPKKLKGRAHASPVKPIQAPKQEIVISSGEDSSSSEEPRWQTGNAEAGPSSRKPTIPLASQKKKTAKVQSAGVRIDPSIRNTKAEQHSTAAPATLPRRTSTLDAISLRKSTSRPPALVVNETISLSSVSESELESDAEVELQALSSKMPTGTKSETRTPNTIQGVRKAVNVSVKRPDDHLKGALAPSQAVSKVPSSRSRSTVSTISNCEHVNQAASRQLQLESRQSIPVNRMNQASPTNNPAVGNKVINQGLDHAGRLPNGIRPAYYQYPTLTELQKLPRPVTPEEKPRLDLISSQPVSASSIGKSGSDDSSSDSAERSSNSDENEFVNGSPYQVRPWKRYPGLKDLAQIAKTLRST